MGPGNAVQLLTGAKVPTQHNREINMATTYEIDTLNEFTDSAVKSLTYVLPTLAVASYCWLTGRTRVSGAQDKIARNLAYGVDLGDTDLESVTERYELNGKLVERRVRGRRKMPYVSFLVATIRGAHLEQCSRTESNELVFGRHARSLMAAHGVRPTDAARVLPLAASLFFDHRSVDQIDAVAITQAASFKSSRRGYSAKYVSWGWADSLLGTA